MLPHVQGWYPIVADENCGYRAIAQQLGWDQDNWRRVRSEMAQTTFAHWNNGLQDCWVCLVETPNVLQAITNIAWTGPGEMAPEETWLQVPAMGCVVATTFNCALVVLEKSVWQTYLPIVLDDNITQGEKLPICCICLFEDERHFISMPIAEHSPLPEVYDMWHRYCSPATRSLIGPSAEQLGAYKRPRAPAKNKKVNNVVNLN